MIVEIKRQGASILVVPARCAHLAEVVTRAKSTLLRCRHCQRGGRPSWASTPAPHHSGSADVAGTLWKKYKN